MKRFLRWLLSAFRPTPPVPTARDVAPIIDQDSAIRLEVQRAQDKAAILNEAKHKAERLATIKAWSEPEAVKERYEAHQAAAAAALEKGLAMSRHAREALGMPLEDPPLPPEDQLPKEMHGQSVSTIRAMLRHENWTYDGSGWKSPKPKFTINDGPIERCWRQERMPAHIRDD